MFFQKAPHVIRTKELVTWETQPCIADVWPEPIKTKSTRTKSRSGCKRPLSKQRPSRGTW